MQNELWPYLAKADDDGVKTNTVHVWVDSRPSSVHLDVKNKCYNKHICKKGSDSASPVTTVKIRNSKSRKKNHPRSHAISPTASLNDSTVDETVFLCRQHFFLDICSYIIDRKGSKKTCPYTHLSEESGQQTLANVLRSPLKDCDKKIMNQKSSVSETLKTSSTAAAVAFSEALDGEEKYEGEDGPIDMVYYLPIPPFSSTTSPLSRDGIKNDNFEGRIIVTDLISKALASENCPLGSIVYVALNENLIFDRYNGGILVDKECVFEDLSAKCMSKPVRVDVSLGEGNSGDNKINSLPGSILEYILKFLPDEAAGVLPMVCKLFNREIGKPSPSLWKYFITRRSWPMPNDECPIHNLGNLYKEWYLSHYRVVRDVCCLQKGVQRLRNSDSCESVAVVKHRDVPICFRSWNKTSVIVADRFNCTLKLYEATRNGFKLLCKQTADARVAPFPNSKKIYCCLMSMDLDDEFIFCYYKTAKQGGSSHNTWFVVILRSDFLCHAGSANLDGLDIFQKIDMRECYLDYLKENLETGNLPHTLAEFISDGVFDGIGLLIFSNIEVCGNGRFMIIAEVFLPDHDNEYVVLMLYSVRVRAIIWSHCVSEGQPIPIRSESILSSVHHPQSAISSTILCCALSPMHLIRVSEQNDKVEIGIVDERLITSRNQILFPDCWPSLDILKRLCLVTKRNIVFADILQVRSNSKIILVLSFLKFRDGSDFIVSKKDSTSSIVLERFNDVISIHSDGKDHVIVLCSRKKETGREEANTIVDGLCLDLAVVHIPSKSVISCCCVTTCNEIDEFQKLSYNGAKSDIIALFVQKQGLVMTSHLLRCLTDHNKCNETSSESFKKGKKKKRLASRGGKKDGFARGMSLRG